MIRSAFCLCICNCAYAFVWVHVWIVQGGFGKVYQVRVPTCRVCLPPFSLNYLSKYNEEQRSLPTLAP